MTMPIVTVLPERVRPLLAAKLPAGPEPRWFTTPAEALAIAPGAEIGWFDMPDKAQMAQAILAATRLRWLNSIYAGVDGMPLEVCWPRCTRVPCC